MLDRLKEIEERYLTVEAMLGDPGITADMARFRDLRREYSSLTPVIEEYRTYRRHEKNASEADMLAQSGDREMRELAAEEARAEKSAMEESMQKLMLLMIPKDPNDERSVIVEIRACAGGEEACLFASDLYRMYVMFCTTEGYAVSVIAANRTELGGFRKIVFSVEGTGAYSRLRFESGIHEVKRVPVTEAQGRIQTSTVSVAVMPEADEVDVVINPSDVIMEACRSSGAGGQHINKTDSAVRLTHIPTGTVVECQEERSQLQNREKAMKALRAILYDRELREREKEITDRRRSIVGTGDRSERIRIYRFQENLICDERIKYKSPTLRDFLNGNMGGLIDALSAAETAEKMKNGETV